MWSALAERTKITIHFTPFTSIKWPESLLETVDVVDQNVTMNDEKEQRTMGDKGNPKQTSTEGRMVRGMDEN